MSLWEPTDSALLFPKIGFYSQPQNFVSRGVRECRNLHFSRETRVGSKYEILFFVLEIESFVSCIAFSFCQRSRSVRRSMASFFNYFFRRGVHILRRDDKADDNGFETLNFRVQSREYVTLSWWWDRKMFFACVCKEKQNAILLMKSSCEISFRCRLWGERKNVGFSMPLPSRAEPSQAELSRAVSKRSLREHCWSVMYTSII